MTYMPITITMTNKGQFTLPARVRKALALDQRGEKLTLTVEPDSQRIVLSKPMSFADIQAKARSYVKLGTPPLMDVDALYNTREARL